MFLRIEGTLIVISKIIIGIYLLFTPIIIQTLHDCPSQMNEHLLIGNVKLTSDSELIWWC